MLLAAGADLCARDNNNKMPIQHAEDVPVSNSCFELGIEHKVSFPMLNPEPTTIHVAFLTTPLQLAVTRQPAEP